MSRIDTISNEIMTPIVVNNTIECELVDGSSTIWRTNSTGYSQSCGGWRCKTTGNIYAVNNYGRCSWKTDTVYCITDINANTVKTCTGFVHPQGAQMVWWMTQKNIDTSNMEAISFMWQGCGVGDASYAMQKGPQKGESFIEPLPAQIPRSLHHAVQNIEVIGDNVCADNFNVKVEPYSDASDNACSFSAATVLTASDYVEVIKESE